MVYASRMRPPLALALGAALAAALACAGAGSRPGRAPGGLTPEAAAGTLSRFVEALEARRFADAHALLSERWRAAGSPGRLAVDHAGAGPVAAEAAARVRRALAEGVPVEVRDGRATLPVAPGRAAVLVAEGRAWRVDALE